MQQAVLAIDCGTQSVRALIINREGNVLGKGQVSLAWGSPFTVEQEPLSTDLLWQAVCDAVVSAQSHMHSASTTADIQALAVTTQRATSIVMDADLQPLMPVMQWTGGEAASNTPTLPLWLRLGARIIGLNPLLDQLQQRAVINQLWADHPNIWKRIDYMPLLSGWLNLKLTNQRVDCNAAQVGYVPFDHKKGQWHSQGHWKWKALAFQPGQLPDLAPVTETLGPLTTQAALELQLPEQIPVIACAGDKACELLGSGITQPGQALLSFGTAASAVRLSSRYSTVQAFRPAYLSAQQDYWAPEVQLDRGFWQTSWFIRHMMKDQHTIQEAMTQLDTWLEETPAGANGLLSLPHWVDSMTHPSPNRQGVMIGLNESHDRAMMYRSIKEGILFALRHGLEHLDKKLGQAEETIWAAGGGAKSDAIMQLAANVLSRPVTRPAEVEASAIGAAITAMLGLAWYEDAAQAAQYVCQTGKTFEPEVVDSEYLDWVYKQRYLPADRLLPRLA